MKNVYLLCNKNHSLSTQKKKKKKKKKALASDKILQGFTIIGKGS